MGKDARLTARRKVTEVDEPIKVRAMAEEAKPAPRFRNQFLEDTIGTVLKYKGCDGPPDGKFFYGCNHYLKDRMAGISVCYANLQHDTEFKSNQHDWFWMPPSWLEKGHNDDVQANIRYVRQTIFHEDSPWKPITDLFTAQFEGYETLDEKAELVGTWGWVFDKKGVTDNLTLDKIGALLIFWRQAYEFGFVRKTLEHVTKKFPEIAHGWAVVFTSMYQMDAKGKVTVPSNSNHQAFQNHENGCAVWYCKGSVKADPGMGWTKGCGPSTWRGATSSIFYTKCKIPDDIFVPSHLKHSPDDWGESELVTNYDKHLMWMWENKGKPYVG